MLEKYKYPLEYELNPTEIEKGSNWITLKLKNIGTATLNSLDVQLHSMDTYNLSVFGSWWSGAGQLIANLGPNEEHELVFRVNSIGSADVYVTIRGTKDGINFWWESSWTSLHVSDAKAYLESLLVLSNPYTTIGRTISAEATIKGLRQGTGLRLEFWVETPSGKFEEQAKIDIKELSAGEEARYTAEFTPNETGDYTVYAYLFDGSKRIGFKTDFVYAQKE